MVLNAETLRAHSSSFSRMDSTGSSKSTMAAVPAGKAAVAANMSEKKRSVSVNQRSAAMAVARSRIFSPVGKNTVENTVRHASADRARLVMVPSTASISSAKLKGDGAENTLTAQARAYLGEGTQKRSISVGGAVKRSPSPTIILSRSSEEDHGKEDRSSGFAFGRPLASSNLHLKSESVDSDDSKEDAFDFQAWLKQQEDDWDQQRSFLDEDDDDARDDSPSHEFPLESETSTQRGISILQTDRVEEKSRKPVVNTVDLLKEAQRVSQDLRTSSRATSPFVAAVSRSASPARPTSTADYSFDSSSDSSMGGSSGPNSTHEEQHEFDHLIVKAQSSCSYDNEVNEASSTPPQSKQTAKLPTRSSSKAHHTVPEADSDDNIDDLLKLELKNTRDSMELMYELELMTAKHRESQTRVSTLELQMQVEQKKKIDLERTTQSKLQQLEEDCQESKHTIASLTQELEDAKFQLFMKKKGEELDDETVSLSKLSKTAMFDKVNKRHAKELEKEREKSQRKITALQEELEELKFEQFMLKKDQEIEVMEGEALEAAMVLDLKQELSATVEMHKESQARIVRLEKELASSENNCKSAREELAEARSKIDELISERENYQNQVFTLQTELSIEKEARKEVNDLHEEATREILSMRKKHEDYIDAISLLKKDLETATQDNRAQEIEYEMVQKLEMISKKQEKYRDQVTHLKMESSAANDKVKTLEEELAVTQQMMKVVQEENEENEQRMEKHTVVIRTLTEQLELSQKENDAQRNEMMEKLEQLQNDNTKVCKKHQDEVESYKQQNAKLCKKHQDEIESYRHENVQLCKKYQDEIESYQQENAELCKKYQEEIDFSKQEHAAECKKHKEELEKCRREHLAQRDEISAQLQEQILVLEQDDAQSSVADSEETDDSEELGELFFLCFQSFCTKVKLMGFALLLLINPTGFFEHLLFSPAVRNPLSEEVLQEHGSDASSAHYPYAAEHQEPISYSPSWSWYFLVIGGAVMTYSLMVGLYTKKFKVMMNDKNEHNQFH